MILDEAIQSFEDEMEKQTVLGHPEHIDNLEQMADWLRELKAYRENTCGDAINREELIEALNTWDKFSYAPTNELIPLRDNVDKDKYVPYIHYDDVLTCIRNMPSVTPQPCGNAISREEAYAVVDRMLMGDRNHKIIALEEIQKLPPVTPQQRLGQWEQTRYRSIDQTGESYDDGIGFRCSNCANVFKVTSLARYHYCPNCGARMEVQE